MRTVTIRTTAAIPARAKMMTIGEVSVKNMNRLGVTMAFVVVGVPLEIVKVVVVILGEELAQCVSFVLDPGDFVH